jgi:AdoMet-dependent heme synthase
MTIPVKFPSINPLQEFEVSLVDFPQPVSNRLASREQCNCDCACTPLQATQRQQALSLPTAFYLELTSWCPNRCMGCGNIFIDRRERQRNGADMNWEDWKTVLQAIAPSATMVRLTGGEPTQSPHFDRIVQFLEQHAIPFAVLTSGSWPNPQKLLASLSSKAQFQGFLISLHGATARQHELFTQVTGSHQTALHSIQQATEAGMDVSVSAILLQSNLGQLRELADTALAHGAKNIIFARHIGQTVSEITLDDGKLLQAVEEVLALQHHGYPVKLGNCIPQCFHENPSTGCTAGLTFCTVDPSGNLRPCNHSKTVVGNLFMHSLAELWDSKKLKDWRAMVSSACSACSAYARCAGGCKVMYEDGRDALMTGPLETFGQTRTQSQVSLFRHSIPYSKYVQKTDTFGQVLLGKGLVIPIGHDVEEFLQETIEKKTLGDIQGAYGNPALSFIADLHALGLVELL